MSILKTLLRPFTKQVQEPVKDTNTAAATSKETELPEIQLDLNSRPVTSSKQIRHTFTDDDRMKSGMKTKMLWLERKQIQLLENELQHLETMQNRKHLTEKIHDIRENMGLDIEEEFEEDESLFGEFQPVADVLVESFNNAKATNHGSEGRSSPKVGDLEEYPDEEPESFIIDHTQNTHDSEESGERLDEFQIRNLAKKLPAMLTNRLKKYDTPTLKRLVEVIKDDKEKR